MSTKLNKMMHLLILGPVALIIVIILLYYFDPYDYTDGSGELGYSLLYSFLYLLALAVGFIGWILSIVVFAKNIRLQTTSSRFALVYMLLGLAGFIWAFYLMRAS